MWQLFRKKYTVKCPDGTTRTVYHNIDDAFPLHLEDVKRTIDTSASGLDQIKAGARYTNESKISSILTGMDRVNQSMQAHFRAAYTVFEASPCSELPYLRNAIEKIIVEEQHLRAAETVISALRDFVLTRPENYPADIELVSVIDQRLAQAIELLLPAPVAALPREMAEAHKRVLGWQKDD